MFPCHAEEPPVGSLWGSIAWTKSKAKAPSEASLFCCRFQFGFTLPNLSRLGAGAMAHTAAAQCEMIPTVYDRLSVPDVDW